MTEIKKEGSFSSDSSTIETEIDGTETIWTTTFKVSGNRTVTMKYDMSEITIAQRRKVFRIEEEKDNGGEKAIDLIADLVESCVISWDFKTKKGKTIEPTAEATLNLVSESDLVQISLALFKMPSGNVEGVA